MGRCFALHYHIARLTRPCFAYQSATGASISLQQRSEIAPEQPVQLPLDVVVPDILFERELKENHRYLLDMGLKVKGLDARSIEKIEYLNMKYSRPSINDHAALALAIQEQCPLLTGDKDLREAAKNEGIQVHGTLWIMEKFLECKLLKITQARNGFDLMKAKGSRLPWSEVEKLLTKWESLEIQR